MNSSLKLVLRVPPSDDDPNKEKDDYSASGRITAASDNNNSNSLISPDVACCGEGSSSNLLLENNGNNSIATPSSSTTTALPPLLTSEIDPSSNNNNNDKGSVTSSTGGNKKKRKKRKLKFTAPPMQKMPKLKRKIEDASSDDKDSQSAPSKKKIIAEGPGLDTEAESAAESPDPDPSSNMVEYDTPLQRLLDYMLSYIEKKDPENYFANPVSDEIAPNYSSVIQKPMDFSTMRRKLNENEYKSLQDFQDDVELIINNAATYNDPGTLFYIAAKKLKSIKSYLFCKERLLYLQNTLPYVSQLTEEELGVDLRRKPVLKVPKPPLTDYSCIVDDMSAEDVLAQVSIASEVAREKLATRRPNCKAAYLSTKKDGTTTLKLLPAEKFDHTRWTEAETAEFDENSGPAAENSAPAATKERKFCLGDLLPKLKEGAPNLTQFEINPVDLVTPHRPLDYGPFASFAPTFDSTWATLSKEESDLLLCKFNNDETCVNYIDSVRRYIHGTNDHLVEMVDGLLDALTDGEYSKQFNNNNSDEDIKGTISNVDSTCSDISISKDIVIEDNSNSNGAPATLSAIDTMLSENCSLLQDLHKTQYERLSRPPPLVITHVPGPSSHETQIAEQYLSNLRAITAQVAPGDLVSTSTVRSFMTSAEGEESNSSDEYDMEVFKEFFQVENTTTD